MSIWAVSAACALALVLVGDALLSIKPPAFIRRCLSGVGFPENWWWTLIGVKLLAAVGLVFGAVVKTPEFSAAAAIGVVCYFAFALVAHIKARFIGSEFWINCLGMFIFSIIVTALQLREAFLPVA